LPSWETTLTRRREAVSEIITCPSGLTGRIRGMKAREERILADRKLARSGAQLEQILAACWEETLAPGPYDFGDQPIDWSKVLQGDRFFTLLQVRVLSYGPEYAFSVPCENRSCRARIEWEVDLRTPRCGGPPGFLGSTTTAVRVARSAATER
jgi:hypothetical protein